MFFSTYCARKQLQRICPSTCGGRRLAMPRAGGLNCGSPLAGEHVESPTRRVADHPLRRKQIVSELVRLRRQQGAEHRQKVAERLADLGVALARDLDGGCWDARLEEIVEHGLRLAPPRAQMV